MPTTPAEEAEDAAATRETPPFSPLLELACFTARSKETIPAAAGAERDARDNPVFSLPSILIALSQPFAVSCAYFTIRCGAIVENYLLPIRKEEYAT